MLAQLENADISLTHQPSLTGRHWHIKEADERLVAAFTRTYNLPDLLARILACRGIGLEDAEKFLNPSLKALMPDPSHLLDMDAAATRVASAISGGETIAVFGDYDVDGATSSALIMLYLQALGCKPMVHIPDRMIEGYGPNTPALLGLQKAGATLVITVDCGTMAFEPLEAAHEAGLDVIVVDHHIGEARKPKAYAIVNPNRLDETSPHGQMAAVGVAFLLIVAVNRALRVSGYFNETRKEPDVRQWLDLVAVGTVCDVVPLTGVNRAFVAQGLKILGGRNNLGLRTVLDLAASSGTPSVYHCGFVIGPRINAGGRVGKSDLGVRLLSCADEVEAMMLARELELHNAERKAIESMVVEQAMEMAHGLESQPVMVVAGKGWHPGVIGIVAGRLKERFHKPVAVIALNGGVGKASARSVAGFDFGGAVIAAHAAGILLGGGGHAMAAGFSIDEGKVQDLTEFFAARVAAKPLATSHKLTLDGIISIGGATIELLSECERLGPFGQGNPSLRLMVERVVNFRPEIVGEHHIKTLFIDPQSSSKLQAIAFRSVGTQLGDALLNTRGKTVDVAGQLKIQEWNGRVSANLTVDDIRLGQ